MTYPELSLITYGSLRARQKEYFNFHQVAAILAHYGYACHWMNDDWEGADFIGVHLNGAAIRVQLKSRFSVEKKYIGKKLLIAFPAFGCWYLYPHDDVVDELLSRQRLAGTRSWDVGGSYSIHSDQLSAEMQTILLRYKLGRIHVDATRNWGAAA